ncbi:Crp/Fnr family transcriptional regulator [Jannaschia sp. S6380]|uniref:Crp/Fnr family transcriptional regulator n=1 Tax=Jannaschia sp. S6380 TaxID=2926408 RepID=UPI001FF3EC22|nr:Crp/Fnr family transcriptional regulator [Jannaschia sp. S6380]MCK0167190.1 Crp/Fnr family transcriptional regulator [Jannaschia sp. S6380]
MAIKCVNCPLRRRDAFLPMTEEELRFQQRFKVGELTVEPQTQILMEGSNSPQLFTALHGLGLRYKILEDQSRQILSFVFPGDFIGLQAGVMGEMGHSVRATTRMTLCVFDRGELWNLFRSHPDRAFDLTWLASSEERFLGEAMSTIGQRSASAAIAWALVKLYRRGAMVGLAMDGVMELPFRQRDLADALGLSLVHTNKTLARLREMQLANWSEGVLTVPDLAKLEKAASGVSATPAPRPLF